MGKIISCSGGKGKSPPALIVREAQEGDAGKNQRADPDHVLFLVIVVPIVHPEPACTSGIIRILLSAA